MVREKEAFAPAFALHYIPATSSAGFVVHCERLGALAGRGSREARAKPSRSSSLGASSHSLLSCHPQTRPTRPSPPPLSTPHTAHTPRNSQATQMSSGTRSSGVENDGATRRRRTRRRGKGRGC